MSIERAIETAADSMADHGSQAELLAAMVVIMVGALEAERLRAPLSDPRVDDAIAVALESIDRISRMDEETADERIEHLSRNGSREMAAVISAWRRAQRRAAR